MVREFKETKSVEEAWSVFQRALPSVTPDTEEVPLSEALLRILAEDIISETDVPPIDKSAVDGYAVVAEDTFGALPTNTVVLNLVGEVKMGTIPSFHVKRKEAAGVTTGSILPEGANAVIMVEHTRQVDANSIEIYTSVSPMQDVVQRGEDVRKGQRVLPTGTRLRAQHLGVLANLGHVRVKAFRRPRVAVLSTGDELVDVSGGFDLAKTVDVNRVVISAMVREAGGEPVDMGIASDRLDAIRTRIKDALNRADVTVVSGGSSVSEIDRVPNAINDLGSPGVVVHGISIRPASPTGLAVVDGKPIVILSGYPVAAIVGFNLFVKPLILRILSAKSEPEPTIRARLVRRVPHSTGLRTFARVVVRKTTQGYEADPLRTSGSGVLTSMTRANGILIIPENVEGFEAGDEVEVLMMAPAVEG